MEKKIRNSALDRIRQKNAMRWMLLRRSHTNFRCLKTTWVHWGNLTYKRSPKRTKTRHKKATPSISPKRKFIKIHFWTFWASSLPQSCFKACTRWITSWRNWLLHPVQLVPNPNDPKFLMCSLKFCESVNTMLVDTCQHKLAMTLSRLEPIQTPSNLWLAEGGGWVWQACIS